jgi:hypothetical protein
MTLPSQFCASLGGCDTKFVFMGKPGTSYISLHIENHSVCTCYWNPPMPTYLFPNPRSSLQINTKKQGKTINTMHQKRNIILTKSSSAFLRVKHIMFDKNFALGKVKINDDKPANEIMGSLFNFFLRNDSKSFIVTKENIV